MKKFKFNLESFLHLKKYFEEKAKQDLAFARSDLLECEKNIDHLKKNYSKIIKNLGDETSAGIDSNRYLFVRSRLSEIESLLESENMHRREFSKVFVEKQKKLAEKSVKRKSLENLKEDLQGKYYQEIASSLNKETDDNVILRKAREINDNFEKDF